MPLLYFITFLWLVVIYIVDKYNFLRNRKKSPVVDDRMDRVANTLLSFVVILHIIIAIIVFGNDDLFEED